MATLWTRIVKLFSAPSVEGLLRGELVEIRIKKIEAQLQFRYWADAEIELTSLLHQELYRTSLGDPQ